MENIISTNGNQIEIDMTNNPCISLVYDVKDDKWHQEQRVNKGMGQFDWICLHCGHIENGIGAVFSKSNCKRCGWERPPPKSP